MKILQKKKFIYIQNLLQRKKALKVWLKRFQLPCMKKNFFKKEVDSLEVEIKHVKRENYTINKRHKHINEKFTDLEEETMETITEEKSFY